MSSEGTRHRRAGADENCLARQQDEVWSVSGFGGCGIDNAFYFRDRIGRETALPGVFANDLLVGCVVDAVDLVAGDVAVDPLNFGAELTQDSAGSLGDGL